MIDNYPRLCISKLLKFRLLDICPLNAGISGIFKFFDFIKLLLHALEYLKKVEKEAKIREEKFKLLFMTGFEILKLKNEKLGL